MYETYAQYIIYPIPLQHTLTSKQKPGAPDNTNYSSVSNRCQQMVLMVFSSVPVALKCDVLGFAE